MTEMNVCCTNIEKDLRVFLPASGSFKAKWVIDLKRPVIGLLLKRLSIVSIEPSINFY
jgi:hypothetical protein